MFCPDPAGEIEMRYARLLQAVKHMVIKGGELVLSYEFEGNEGAMIFKARENGGRRNEKGPDERRWCRGRP